PDVVQLRRSGRGTDSTALLRHWQQTLRIPLDSERNPLLESSPPKDRPIQPSPTLHSKCRRLDLSVDRTSASIARSSLCSKRLGSQLNRLLRRQGCEACSKVATSHPSKQQRQEQR